MTRFAVPLTACAFAAAAALLASAPNAQQAASPPPAAEKPAAAPTTAEPPSADDICRAIEQDAAENELPVEFFARVIWQESRFNARAVSSKGAQGIAQFMPQTASGAGLPIRSIRSRRCAIPLAICASCARNSAISVLPQPATTPVPAG